MDRHVGLLVVHGIGEQRRFETARQIARSLMAALQARRDGAHFSLIDRSGNPDEMPLSNPRIDRAGSPFMIACRAEGAADREYLHLHEVWWSDLGAPSSLSEQVRFWLWGLGQWLAPVIWKSHFATGASNTDVLMEPPTKFQDVEKAPDRSKPRPIARSLLFVTGIYAFLTLFSWEGLKRAFSWLTPYSGSPAILTSYVGDVRIYTQAPGRGGGNITDVGQPWRATIRRRMIGEMVAMAERRYDRWYVLAHSLGSVVAFNGVQEHEWNLPNYLDPAQVERVRSGPLKDELWISTPPGDATERPNLNRMMPRRPVWLGDDDRISRMALFARFGGLVTYGSPLDKFAALWPRIVPVNKKRDAFPEEADWVNLSDATDPVGANIEAFQMGWSSSTTSEHSPLNLRVRASWIFLLAHIRYFGEPSKSGRDHPETRALLDVLLPGPKAPPRLREAFARVGDDYGSRAGRLILTGVWILVLGIVLVAATSWIAKILVGIGHGLAAGASGWLERNWSHLDWLAALGVGPRTPERAWSALIRTMGILPVDGFAGTMATTLIAAVAVVFLAGVWRHAAERTKAKR